MVNVTKDKITTRMAITDEDIWPPKATDKPQLPDPTEMIPYTEFIRDGKLDMDDVVQPIYDEINKMYGLNEKMHSN